MTGAQGLPPPDTIRHCATCGGIHDRYEVEGHGHGTFTLGGVPTDQNPGVSVSRPHEVYTFETRRRAPLFGWRMRLWFALVLGLLALSTGATVMGLWVLCRVLGML